MEAAAAALALQLVQRVVERLIQDTPSESSIVAAVLAILIGWFAAPHIG